MVHWVKKSNGKELAIVNGYTFYCHKQTMAKCTWTCTNAMRCKARMMITNELDPADLRWVRRHSGVELAIVGSYTFYCRKRLKSRNTWWCTNSQKCKARLSVTNENDPASRIVVSSMLNHSHPPPKIWVSNVRWVRRHSGVELAIVGSYTFYCRKRLKSRNTWWCTNSQKCKARLSVTNENDPASRIVVSSMLNHSHPPPKIWVSNVLQWVRKKDGKELAVVNGYTFYCHKSNVKTKTWSCTKGGFCKARLIITNENRAAHRTVVSAKLEHVHPPPAFIISNGFYVKI
uniref:FLYWCH-type domain-containing protein n=1 Tax=Heliothis virescens TaxID=7102 RepID=A0A2A4J083_HELVI